MFIMANRDLKEFIFNWDSDFNCVSKMILQIYNKIAEVGKIHEYMMLLQYLREENSYNYIIKYSSYLYFITQKCH